MIRLKDPDVEPPDSSQLTAAIPINHVDRNCSQCRAVILLCPCRSHVAQLLHPVLICMHDAQQLGRKVDRLCKSVCSPDLVFCAEETDRLAICHPRQSQFGNQTNCAWLKVPLQVNAGADVTAKTKDAGHTALDLATRKGHHVRSSLRLYSLM